MTKSSEETRAAAAAAEFHVKNPHNISKELR